jgi:acyl carrier protein
MSSANTLNNNLIISKINAIFVEEFEVEAETLSPEKNLKETLDLDSLDYVDLVVLIDDNFGFKPKAEDFTTIVTIDDFYNFVINKTKD